MGVAVTRAVSFAMMGPARRYRPIKAETVARAMVAAADLERVGVYVYESDEIARIPGNVKGPLL